MRLWPTARSSSEEGPERRAAACKYKNTRLNRTRAKTDDMAFCAKRCSLAASRASRRCLLTKSLVPSLQKFGTFGDAARNLSLALEAACSCAAFASGELRHR